MGAPAKFLFDLDFAAPDAAKERAANFLAYMDARYGSVALSAEKRDEWMVFCRVVANAKAQDWTKAKGFALSPREIWESLGRNPNDPSKARGKAAYSNWDAQLKSAEDLIDQATDESLKKPLK